MWNVGIVFFVNAKSFLFCLVLISWGLFRGENQSFLFPILLCTHTGNYPQEELPKFGYRSERKENKLKNPVTFWQPAKLIV
jgi:hypothetical protein